MDTVAATAIHKRLHFADEIYSILSHTRIKAVIIAIQSATAIHRKSRVVTDLSNARHSRFRTAKFQSSLPKSTNYNANYVRCNCEKNGCNKVSVSAALQIRCDTGVRNLDARMLCRKLHSCSICLYKCDCSSPKKLRCYDFSNRTRVLNGELHANYVRCNCEKNCCNKVSERGALIPIRHTVVRTPEYVVVYSYTMLFDLVVTRCQNLINTYK